MLKAIKHIITAILVISLNITLLQSKETKNIINVRDKYNYELSVLLGKVRSECQLRQDYDKNIGVRLQFNQINKDVNILNFINLNIKPEILLDQSYTKSKYKRTPTPQSKTHTTRTELNAIGDIKIDSIFEPYLLAGLGYEKFSHTYNKNNNGLYFNMGAGIKYPFKKYKYAIKFEGKNYTKLNGNGKNQERYGFFLGLSIAFGDKQCLDEDKDGVCDKIDKCFNTLKGAIVDNTGCKKQIVSLKKILNIKFKKSSSKYFVNKEKTLKDIKEFAIYLKTINKYCLIEGHTSSEDTALKNYYLSENRAITIKKLLLKQGISKNKIETIGYGELRPSYIPTSDERNRRIETMIFDTRQQMWIYINKIHLTKKGIIYEMDIK